LQCGSDCNWGTLTIRTSSEYLSPRARLGNVVGGKVFAAELSSLGSECYLKKTVLVLSS
jgi:hypothetical protein